MINASIFVPSITLCVGNYWIIQTFGKFSVEPGKPNYCNPVLYWYSVGVTLGGYILIALIVIVALVCGCCLCACCVCSACCAKLFNTQTSGKKRKSRRRPQRV